MGEKHNDLESRPTADNTECRPTAFKILNRLSAEKDYTAYDSEVTTVCFLITTIMGCCRGTEPALDNTTYKAGQGTHTHQYIVDQYL